MTPGNYDFREHTRGDTLTTVQMTLTQTVNGVTSAINLTGCVIVAMFKKKATLPPALTMSTANGYITITNARAGIIRFNPIPLNIDAGQYSYDVEFTFPSGERKTYVAGTLQIENDITR